MSNIDVSPEPLFSTEMTKIEVITPVHADIFNPRDKQLLENDLYLKQQHEKLKTELKEAAYKEVTNVPTENSTKLITSGAVFSGLGEKSPLVHNHSKSQIRDFPSTMPASDVYSWAKQPNKPSYNANEVGALPVGGKAVSAGSADSATNASNSDKVDNYHIQVVASVPASTVANTIYFVTE